LKQILKAVYVAGVNGTPSFFINGDKLDSYDATYESLADAVRASE